MDEPVTAGPVQIAAACDVKYAMPLAVMLASVNASLGQGRRAVAHVLESGLDAATKARVARSLPDDRLQLRWIPVHPDRLVHLRGTLRSFDTVSLASYYRLLLPEAVPRDLDRLIYLDSDLVVLHDLWDLWSTDIGDTCLGAVPELLRSARHASSPAGIRLHRELGLQPDLELFNSGVMVLNLAKWRQTEVAARALTYVREAAGYLRWHDQEALNVVAAGDWTRLDARWNVTMHVFRGKRDTVLRALVEAPRIVHYNAAIKPWDAGFRLGFGDVFYRILDTTAWSGWRPPRSNQSPLRRWSERLVRTSRKARHALGRRLQVAGASLRGWHALRQRPLRIAGPPVPETRREELRVFITATAGNACAVRAVSHYLSRGADRVLLVVEQPLPANPDMATELSTRLHVFLPTAAGKAGNETLRQLLRRYGRNHWCIVVSDDEQLLGAHPGGALTDLRDYLAHGDYDALECQVRDGDDSSDPHERFRRVEMTATDPFNGRLFRVPVDAAPSGERIEELDCRSKVVMLRYGQGMLIDREFRGVQGARLADIKGILRRSRAMSVPPSGSADSSGIAHSTPQFDAFAARRIRRGS